MARETNGKREVTIKIGVVIGSVAALCGFFWNETEKKCGAIAEKITQTQADNKTRFDEAKGERDKNEYRIERQYKIVSEQQRQIDKTLLEIQYLREKTDNHIKNDKITDPKDVQAVIRDNP